MVTFSRETTGAEVVETWKEYIAGKTGDPASSFLAALLVHRNRSVFANPRVSVVITGASAGGLGSQTALDIAAAKPATLVLLARQASKVQPVIDRIAELSPSTKVAFVPIFLDDLESVRSAAAEVGRHVQKIDVLINNAGIMAVPYSKTEIGVESQFATNHLGHFVFTQRLFPLIKAAGKTARVVNLTSNGYLVCPFRADDINFDDGKTYDPLSGYGQSKTANILFTKGLAKRGVTSFAVHPGVIFETHLGDGLDLSIFGTINEVTERNTGRKFGQMDQPKSLEQGSATTLVAAFDPTIRDASGGYLKDCHLTEVVEHAQDQSSVEKLWELSESLVGEKFVI